MDKDPSQKILLLSDGAKEDEDEDPPTTCVVQMGSDLEGSDDKNTVLNDKAGLVAAKIFRKGHKRQPKIPREAHKTLVALIFLVFGGLATHISRAFTTDRVPRTDPLPDLFLDNSTFLSWGRAGSEVAMGVAMLITALLVSFHRHRFVIARRIFFQMGLHYFYRAVLMGLTVLPKPNSHYECIDKLAPNATTYDMSLRVLELMSGMGLKVASRHDFCGDYIYSGHTMVMILSYLAIKEYSSKNWLLLHWFSFITSVSGVLILLLGRGHYSIDIVISYWITTRIWWAYHDVAANIAHNKEKVMRDEDQESNSTPEKKSGRDLLMSQCWWYFIVFYMECNVGHPLPTRFNLPLPSSVLRRLTWMDGTRNEKQLRLRKIRSHLNKEI